MFPPFSRTQQKLCSPFPRPLSRSSGRRAAQTFTAAAESASALSVRLAGFQSKTHLTLWERKQAADTSIHFTFCIFLPILLLLFWSFCCRAEAKRSLQGEEEDPKELVVWAEEQQPQQQHPAPGPSCVCFGHSRCSDPTRRRWKTRLKHLRGSGGGGVGVQAARMVQALPPTAPDRKSSPAQHAPTPGEDEPHSLRDSSREFMYWKNEALSPLSEGSKVLSEGVPAKQVHTLGQRRLVLGFGVLCV